MRTWLGKLFCCLCVVLTSVSGVVPALAAAPDDAFPATGLIAQNTTATQNQPVLPPLPDPKTVISTEKPIEGGLLFDPQAMPLVPPQQPTPAPSKTEPSQPAPSRQAPAPQQAATPSQGTGLTEEMNIYNTPTADLRTMKVIIDNQYNLRGLVYGDELTYLHHLQADENGNFREVWRSPSLNGEIRGVFVNDIDGDGESEIVAYTSQGDFFIYGLVNHNLKYKSPEGGYATINCMIIANLDDDPEKEILFIGVRPSDMPPSGQQPAGHLVQFDPVSQFEEWTSQERYTATDMIIGNVDSDRDPEIVLNTGEILDIRFKALKWKSDVPFGSRLYLIDLDNDGLLELVTEYNQAYIRVFDIDQRREKY